jgi:hypothetical protein
VSQNTPQSAWLQRWCVFGCFRYFSSFRNFRIAPVAISRRRGCQAGHSLCEDDRQRFSVTLGVAREYQVIHKPRVPACGLLGVEKAGGLLAHA